MQPNMPDELSRMKDFFYQTLMLYMKLIREWGNLKEEFWDTYIKNEDREMIRRVGELESNQKMSLLGGMASASNRFRRRIDGLYIAARDCQDLSDSYRKELEAIKARAEINPSYEKDYFDKGIDMAGIAFSEVCIPYLTKVRRP